MGDLKRIYLDALINRITMSGNLLADDPEMFKEAETRADDEYVWPEEAEQFLKLRGEDHEAVTAAGD